MKTFLFLLFGGMTLGPWYSAAATISGIVSSENKPVPYAVVMLTGTGLGATTDNAGHFILQNIPEGNYTLRAHFVGYEDFEKQISLKAGEQKTVYISLRKDDKTLSEVVVTGVSGATLIRENPVAIVSISSKQMEQTSAGNLIDMLVKNVPGLNAVKTGANISKPFIRGLGYNRVLTLYDGIRQEGQQWGDEHGLEIDAYNMERVEVIKGPASLMYGSDALAGVVSFFPYVPDYNDEKLHGKFTSEYHTNNNLTGNGLRLHYSTKPFLFSASGSYRRAKNYRNAVDGRVYLTNFDEKNLSVLLGYKTAKGFTHVNFTLFDNRQAIPDGSRDSATRRFTKQIYEAPSDTINNRPFVSVQELNSYKLPPLTQHIRHYRLYTHSSYEVGKGNINFSLGAQQNVRKEYNHPTMPAQAGMYVRLNTLNYGLRYNAPRFVNTELTVGVNGMLQNNRSLDATDFPIPDYNLYEGGLFVYLKWKRRKWTVSGGARVDLRLVKWDNFYVKKNITTGFDERHDFSDTTQATLQFTEYEKLFQGVSASVGATFQVTDNISLKANIGRAYRAPNITEMASNGLDPGAHIIYLGNRNFNPEFSLQEDIGMCARFKNFSADLSLFNNNIQDYIYLNLVVDDHGNPLVDAQGNKTYQYQQAAAQLYGAEIWLAVHPEKADGLRLDNSLALVYGYNRNEAFRGKGVNGEYLPLIPPLKWMSSLSKEIKPSSKYFRSFIPKIEMEYTARQDRYLGLNGTETATPGYVLINCGIAAKINYRKTQSLHIQLNVNNVLDKAYQAHLNRLKYFEHYARSAGEHSGIYNMGRNIGLKLIATF